MAPIGSESPIDLVGTDEESVEGPATPTLEDLQAKYAADLIDVAPALVDDNNDGVVPIFVAPPPANMSEFSDDASRLKCPFCVSFHTIHGPGALMRHITCKHSGQRFGDSGCAVFRGLEKGVCCTPDCKQIRSLITRVCPRCKSSEPPRDPVTEDCVNSAPINSERRAGNTLNQSTPEEPVSESADQSNLMQRIETFPSASLLHIPMSCRPRVCEITTGLLRGIAAGTENSLLLEKSRTT